MKRVLPTLLAAATMGLATPAQSCALALLFAIDVSASVDASEYRLQRDGLANALLAPEVREAILAQHGGVAFGAYEWSGRQQQDVTLDWRLVADEAGLLTAAEEIRDGRRSYAEFPTAIGYALGFGATRMRNAPACARQVIDISGDGIGNEGFPPAAAYREFDFETITVNGLVIADGDEGLVRYYQHEIPHGDGAFVEVARDFADYEHAMRRKLLRELYGPQVAEQ